MKWEKTRLAKNKKARKYRRGKNRQYDIYGADNSKEGPVRGNRGLDTVRRTIKKKQEVERNVTIRNKNK